MTTTVTDVSFDPIPDETFAPPKALSESK